MILVAILGVLFFIVIGIVLYMTYYNYVMASDNDSRLNVIAQKNQVVSQNLKSVTDDINYNDRVLDETGNYVKKSIDNVHVEFAEQLSNVDSTIRYDLKKLSSVYADGVGMRANIALNKLSANIYDSLTMSNLSLSNAIVSNKLVGDANLNARAIALSNMIYSTYTSNADTINSYMMSNNASLLSTNTMVLAQADSFARTQRESADITSKLDVFKTDATNRIVQLENVNTRWTETGLPNFMNQMLGQMDIKDSNLYAYIVKKDTDLAASTGNVNDALIGYSNQMMIVGDNFTKAIGALNARSALDNPMRSNVYADKNTGYIGLGGKNAVFSTTTLPATDLEIRNTTPRVRLTGTQGAAYQLNDQGASLALDASGNMTLDANPTGTLTLQSKTTRGLGVGAVPDQSYLQNYKLFVNGALGVANSSVLELGVGVIGKSAGAGTLQYNTTDNELHIAGAGPINNRKVTLDAEGGVTVNGPLNMASGQKLCIGSTCMTENDLLTIIKNNRSRYTTFTTNTTYTATTTGTYNIFIVGGGGSGTGSHYGGGGAGYITRATVEVTMGSVFTITVGSGGSRTLTGNGALGNRGNSSMVVVLGKTYTATGGEGGGSNGNIGGAGSSGGGGAGNSGGGGGGGTGGNNGANGATYNGGSGMGATQFTQALPNNITGVTFSAGAGGAAGNTTHSGGGGGGGIVCSVLQSPSAENGGLAVYSGQGGVGFGAGGGSGGYNSGTYYYGGAGANGLVVVY